LPEDSDAPVLDTNSRSSIKETAGATGLETVFSGVEWDVAVFDVDPTEIGLTPVTGVENTL
jgi:hypothetical protein